MLPLTTRVMKLLVDVALNNRVMKLLVDVALKFLNLCTARVVMVANIASYPARPLAAHRELGYKARQQPFSPGRPSGTRQRVWG